MSNKEAKKIGIGRITLYYLKKRMREGKKITLKKKTLNKLERYTE